MLLITAALALQIQLTPCTLNNVPVPARCGNFVVPENRALEGGRTITLRVAVISAAESPRAPDALTYFAGGPGQSAIGAAGYIYGRWRALHRTHDFVFVDQRGTGQSTPLDCRAYGAADSLQRWLGSFLPLDAIEQCKARLQVLADLTVYTTDNSVDDLDAVRAALGYDMLDVTGISYGSRAALTYVKRHGAHVRTLVIQGIAPTSFFIPETFARDAQAALDGLVSECAADAACHAAFPDPAGEVQRITAQLARQPARVEIIHPATGAIQSVVFDRDMFGEAIRYLLYSPRGASWVPALVDAAAHGNFTPIAERALLYRYILMGTGLTGLYLSVTCDEDLPFVDVAKSTAMVRGTFLGNYRLRDQEAACQLWPHVAVDKHFQEPTVSNVPALVFSGERDPVTPPANGALVVRTLSRGHHYVIRSGGHSYDGLVGIDCVDTMISHFIDRPQAPVDASCLAGIHRPPFPTTLPWTTAIALDSSALQRFVGRFAGDSAGPSATTRVEGGTLHMQFDGRRDQVLVPVAPARFYVVGTMDMVVRFDRASVVVEEDGQSITTLHAG